MIRRPLWIVMASLVLAALGLWASSRLTWATELRVHPGTDAAAVVTRTGAEVAPLVPLALLALAGVAAAVALGGWPRRLVGVVLVAGGLGVAAIGLLSATATDEDFLPWGRFLALAAAACQINAGVLLVWRADRMPRLGARYETPVAARQADDSDGDMWRTLSEGKDPTTNDS